MRKTCFPAVFLAVIFAFNASYALKIIAYGDTRNNDAMQGIIPRLYNNEKPDAVCFVGDIQYSYTAAGFAKWKDSLVKNPNVKKVIDSGNFCIARGNHDGTFSNLVNSGMVKNSSREFYSWKQGTCFFVCMGYLDAATYPWLRTQFNSDSAKAAKWRFIFQHKPVYSTFSSHGADGNTSEGTSVTLERQYCDTFKVTAVFTGHDHGYERTKLLHHHTVAESRSPYNIRTTPGTVYMLTGGGGAPLGTLASTAPVWRAFGLATFCYTVVNATADTCYFTTKNSTGTVIDEFIVVDKTQVGTHAASSVILSPKIPAISYSSSRMRFAVPDNGKVLLKVYNINGELVSTLVDKQMNSGAYSIDLNRSGGAYICVLSLNGVIFVQKIVVR